MIQTLLSFWPYLLAAIAVLEGLKRVSGSRQEIAKSWFWVKKNVLLRYEHSKLEELEHTNINGG